MGMSTFEVIEQLYNKGLNGAQIARCLKISTTAVNRHLLKIRPPRTYYRDSVIELRRKGLSLRAIANELKITREAVLYNIRTMKS